MVTGQTTQDNFSTRSSSRRVSFLAQRVLAWFALSVVGNLGLIVIAFVLSQPPFALPWDEIIANIATAAAPLYSPTLLFFTAILGVLSSLFPAARARGRVPDSVEEDAEQAERLIARVVQLALTFVLSVAAVVILDDASQVAYVLFATLLGFITFALAERIAPPPTMTPEERFQKAQEYLDRIAGWADDELGQGWRDASTRGAWATLVALLIAPIAFPLAVVAIVTWILFGPEIAFAPMTLIVYAVSMFGTLTLVLSWLASADKADPPRSRLWRGIFLHILSGAAIATLSLPYLLEGNNIWWVGFAVLGSGALALMLLYLPGPEWWHECRLRLQRRLTSPQLRRAEKFRDDAKKTWEASVPSREPWIQRLVQRLTRRRSNSRS